jgi:hypothetical protein
MTTIQRTAAALAALDFTAENERIAELEAQISELEAAIERGEARRTEIAQAMQRGDGPDGGAVAAALLAGGDAMTAALKGPNREAMEAEREALREGLGQLRYQVEDTRTEIDNVRLKPKDAVARAARPIIDQALADVRKSLAALPALYSTIVAVHSIARNARNDLDALRDLLKFARSHDLLQYDREQPVPGDVVAALQGLTGKGAVLGRVDVATSVTMP